MATLKLISSDKAEFIVELAIMKCSTVIVDMVDCLGMDDPDDVIIPLSAVSSPILKMIIAWATHHKDDPPPTQDIDDSWDDEFLKIDPPTLFDLAKAADFLAITELSKLIARGFRKIISGKSRSEYKKALGLD